MFKKTKILVFLILCIVLVMTSCENYNGVVDEIEDEIEEEVEIANFEILDMDIQIGMPESEIISILGEPDRIDPTPYGYEWYIYNSNLKNYLQVGIRDSEVVKIYSNSVKSSFQDINIGMPISDAKEKLSLEDEIVFDYKNATITMWPQGSTKDWLYMNFYPRVGKNSENIIAYYIYDIHEDDKITSILIGDTKSILSSGNYGYQISWRGERPDLEPDDISSEKQKLVDEAIGYQFKDLVNSIRLRNGLHTLDWNEDASVISVQHSKDMYYNDFFNHESPTTGRPADRAEEQGINNAGVGENISMGRNGSILTHEGLMNSLGHRNNILNEKITEFGAGSYQSHKYTQIFLNLW